PWLLVGLPVAVGLFVGLGLERTLPRDLPTRESELLAATSGLDTQAGSRNQFIAIGLCEEVAGKPHQDVDCVLPRGRNQSPTLSPRWQSELLAQITLWKKARDQLSQQGSSESSAWLLASVNTRIGRLEELVLPARPTYSMLFNAALLSEGLRYDALSGRFTPIRWDLARMFDDQPRLEGRLKAYELTLTWLALAAGLVSALLTRLSALRAGLAGALVAALTLAALCLGLLVIADASSHFGEGAQGFALNPFLYALARQAGSLALCLSLSGLVLAAGRFALPVAQFALERLTLIAFLGAVMTMSGYLLLSPAAGSEILKFWIALLCSLSLTKHARPSDIARQVVPRLWHPTDQLSALLSRLGTRSRGGQATTLCAAKVIRFQLLVTLGGVLSSAFVILGLTVLVFHDLGGALLAATLLWALISLLFGPTVGVITLTAGGVLATIALQTDKVAGRVELMLSPMSASVSDFARLLKFMEASRPHGFGLGHIQWCSFEGSCLPLQSLSDYMPVLLQGALGPFWAAFLFLFLGIFYLSLMLVCIRGIGAQSGARRMLFALAFFLLLAAFAQSALTILGGLRLIPLTGLGLPLFSLGISSALSVLVSLSLLAVARS
ncbi:MAG: hypothetical protein EBQ76_07870, partial [Betaproteobacteria bacterium]|nr:hypothetical protein [Betaproteobacteria bacterium]